MKQAIKTGVVLEAEALAYAFYDWEHSDDVRAISEDLLTQIRDGASVAVAENALLIKPIYGALYVLKLPDDARKANYYIDLVYPALI